MAANGREKIAHCHVCFFGTIWIGYVIEINDTTFDIRLSFRQIYFFLKACTFFKNIIYCILKMSQIFIKF